MAVITPKIAALGGVDPLPYATASVGGDSFFAVSGGVYLVHVKNGHTAAQTITIDDPTTPLPPGAAASSTFADVPVSVPNAGERMIVISNIGRFMDSQGDVNLTYSGVASLTLQVIKVL